MVTPLPIEESSGTVAVLLLAVIQGLTEFLPISSSGHLVLARLAMGIEEAGVALDVALHLGTLFAVVWAYRQDVRELVRDVLAGRIGLALWIVVATVPIGVIGMLAKGWIATRAQTTDVAALGLLVTGGILVAGELGRRRGERALAGRDTSTDRSDDPKLVDALWIGLAQATAILPGISRSGSTISVALLRGIPVDQAARLSFLMSIPAVAGAAVVELPGAVEEGFGEHSLGLVIGAMILAGFVGWAGLRTLLLVLARGAFRWFAAYCALLGGMILLFA